MENGLYYPFRSQRVLPVELANTPNTYQNFMNEIFWDFLTMFAIIYIDDILTTDQKEYTHPVKQIL